MWHVRHFFFASSTLTEITAPGPHRDAIRTTRVSRDRTLHNYNQSPIEDKHRQLHKANKGASSVVTLTANVNNPPKANIWAIVTLNSMLKTWHPSTLIDAALLAFVTHSSRVSSFARACNCHSPHLRHFHVNFYAKRRESLNFSL